VCNDTLPQSKPLAGGIVKALQTQTTKQTGEQGQGTKKRSNSRQADRP
jgi:hypothetical protein